MVDRVIRWFLENTFLGVLLALAVLVGGFAALGRIPVDAIPDIGEKQVIVFAEWPGRSPQDVDDQVSYPLTTSLTGTPGVKAIRSMSGFGFSMVFVIFRDEVDYYWARSRVLERMNVAQERLPDGVQPVLGPDATALGQVYWYTLEGEGFDLAELRSIQDWYVRYQLNTVEGVSEVASVGGFVKQYQIDVDPDRMRAHGVTLPEIYEAVRRSNIDVGAKVLERNGIEFFLRGVGFVKSVTDLEEIVIRQTGGTPILVRSVATVSLGPDFRRGALDKGGTEAVGGVVLMRYGENPMAVIERVKERIARIAPGLPVKTLPDGRVSKVRLVPFYDRTGIIEETLATLREALLEEAVVATLIVFGFLLHVRSAAATLVTLPLSVALCFLCMAAAGVESNIMSLAGLAIAIGDVADMGIIMTESIYRKFAAADETRDRLELVYEGATEVGGAIVTAVSNTLVSFIPVFFLEDQEGKLFRPLAFTKTFAIAASVVLAITVVPMMCYLLFAPCGLSRRARAGLAGTAGLLAGGVAYLLLAGAGAQGGQGVPTAVAIGVVVAAILHRGMAERFLPLEQNPVARAIAGVYAPTLRWILAHKAAFLALPATVLMAGMSVWLGVAWTLAPLEWVVNLAAHEPASPALRREMYREPGDDAPRPLLELAQLRWQRVAKPGEGERTRILWRRQDPAERLAEAEAGLEVLAEGRILPGLGREFMPPLDEGSFLYMPSLLPHAGLSEAVRVNAIQDRALAAVPEVAIVVGKVGRAETAIDPAPIGMFETVIMLKPEREWRRKPVRRFFSGWPEPVRGLLARVLPEDRPLSKDELLAELQAATAIPGVLPTFLQPIQTRLIMLQTGFRAMMGVKIYGADLAVIERIALKIEEVLAHVPGATDVVADRIVGKPYLQLEIDRRRIARYGVTIRDVQDVIETALGGENLAETVEGRERYPIRIRYARDFREDLEGLARILVPSSSGAQVPLAQLVGIRTVAGPQEIKGEKGLLVGYVTMNTRDRDEVSVVEDAERHLQAALARGELVVPPGYYWEWSGQFENQARAMARMRVLVPVCLGIMFLMLYLGFKRWWIALVIYFGVLVSASGGFILLAWWGANLSVAVWVGFLVLFGVVDDDGVVIGTYLEDVFEGREFASLDELREAVVEGGLRRIRACLMTTTTTVLGLAPIFWATGRGSDIMQPMAIPSIGGMFVQLLTLFIVPCVFSLVEEWKWARAREGRS